MRRLFSSFFSLIVLLLLIALFVAPSLWRYLSYNNLSLATFNPAAVIQADPTRVVPVYSPAEVPNITMPRTRIFEDLPTVQEGTVLVDFAHGNNFRLEELGYLRGRLAARGLALKTFTGGNLANQLRATQAFMIIAPLERFTDEEIITLQEYVAQGGHLLLIGDPARFGVNFVETDFSFTVELVSNELPLNGLANKFDISFEGDYLYNLTTNEGNFRNIIISQEQFGEAELLAGLEKVALYGVHSMQLGPSARPVLMGDDQTYSSATDRAGGLTLAAFSHNDQVLAIGDVDFLADPYYATLDNGRFITRIADFLAGQEQEDILADFPYFYNNSVDLVYLGDPDLGADAFDEIVTLQDTFRQANLNLTLANAPAEGHDVLYVGLYNQIDESLINLLSEREIYLYIDPPVLTAEEEAALAAEVEAEDDEGIVLDVGEAEATPTPAAVRVIDSPLGSVQMSGSSLIIFEPLDNGQRAVYVLAASKKGLENSIGKLLDLVPLDSDYRLQDCLVTADLAFCPSEVSNEKVEAELLTGGIPSTPAADDDEDEEEDEDEPVDDEDEEDTEDDFNGDKTLDDLELTDQGEIALGDVVEGTTSEDEQYHAWTFSEGPAEVDIILTGGDDFDGILELYDPDGNFVDSSDSTFSAGVESLEGISLDEGSYTIVVSDFFINGGDYELTIVEAGEAPADDEEDSTDDEEDTTDDEEDTSEDDTGIPTVFVYVDDNGVLLDEELETPAAIADLLGDEYEVTVWSATEDGALPEDVGDYDYFIWDSGAYRDEEGSSEDDSFIIFELLLNDGKMLLLGSAPPLLEPFDELTVVNDMEFTDADVTLLTGFEEGQVIEMETSFTGGVLYADDAGEEDIMYLLRGPESENAGEILGSAYADTESEARLLFLALPLQALPADVQADLLSNIMAWLSE